MIRVLGVLALALGGAAAAMLGGAEPIVPEPVPTITVPPRPSAAPLSADLGTRWAATALARPLFNPGRRPTQMPPVEAVSPPSPPRLTGTLIGPSGKRALFAGGKVGDRPATVGENDRVGIWTVQAIRAGIVTIIGPDGMQELRVTAEASRSARADAALASSDAAPHWANPCGRSHQRRASADKPSMTGAGRCALPVARLPPNQASP